MIYHEVQRKQSAQLLRTSNSTVLNVYGILHFCSVVLCSWWLSDDLVFRGRQECYSNMPVTWERLKHLLPLKNYELPSSCVIFTTQHQTWDQELALLQFTRYFSCFNSLRSWVRRLFMRMLFWPISRNYLGIWRSGIRKSPKKKSSVDLLLSPEECQIFPCSLPLLQSSSIEGAVCAL